MLKALYRALRPCGGAVLINGESLHGMRFRDSAARVAALPQDERSELDFLVAEVVRLGAAANPRLRAEELGGVVRDAMARVGVADLADRSVLGLSGGERQRVIIARALAQRTPYLLLDEPTNHLDLRHQTDLLRTLRGTAGTGPAVLLACTTSTSPPRCATGSWCSPRVGWWPTPRPTRPWTRTPWSVSTACGPC